jgi:hypothetical protein
MAASKPFGAGQRDNSSVRQGVDSNTVIASRAFLGTAILSGFLADHLLFELGVLALWLRWAIAVHLSYLLFFGLVQIWLNRVPRGARPGPDEAGPAMPGWLHATAAMGRGFPPLGLLLFPFLVLWGAFRATILLVRDCPEILSEAAQTKAWAALVFKRTSLPFLGILSLCLFIALCAHIACPGSSRPLQAVLSCSP